VFSFKVLSCNRNYHCTLIALSPVAVAVARAACYLNGCGAASQSLTIIITVNPESKSVQMKNVMGCAYRA